ncbi:hypothetical protein FBQ60_17350 [Salmonella enterica]|nr:hypothetical protein [Salmonella enterica subsp. arizonae serovar 62:z4,z32:-]
MKSNIIPLMTSLLSGCSIPPPPSTTALGVLYPPNPIMADGKWHSFPRIDKFSYRYIYPTAQSYPKIIIKENMKEGGYSLTTKFIDCEKLKIAIQEVSVYHKNGMMAYSKQKDTLAWLDVVPDSENELPLVLTCNRLP